MPGGWAVTAGAATWRLSDEREARYLAKLGARDLDADHQALTRRLLAEAHARTDAASWNEVAAHQLLAHAASACTDRPEETAALLHLVYSTEGPEALRAALEARSRRIMPRPAPDASPAAWNDLHRAAEDAITVWEGRPWTPPGNFPALAPRVTPQAPAAPSAPATGATESASAGRAPAAAPPRSPSPRPRGLDR